ncbi:hypothetical protein [Undibacterium sp. Ji42W]
MEFAHLTLIESLQLGHFVSLTCSPNMGTRLAMVQDDQLLN